MTRDEWHEKFVGTFGREPTAQELQTTLDNGDIENEFTASEEDIHIHLADTISEVFKKHSRTQADRIFISGTSLTTPREEDIAATWPKPWLYSRVLLFFLASYALLFFIQLFGETVPSYVGLIFIGALAVPFSVVVFFVECNAPRNISFWSVLQMFFIGGILSLIITMFLDILSVSMSGLFGPLTIGIVEELGKLAACAIFVHILNPKYILNGLVIGGSIGAGFAVFETAGYGFDALTGVLDELRATTQGREILNSNHFSDIIQVFGFPEMNQVIIMRGLTSVGSHVAWAAISGAALVLAMHGDKLHMHHFFSKRFLSLFWIPIVLHAAWDLGLAFPSASFLQHPGYWFILILLAWATLLMLINTGLKQIERLQAAPSGRQVEPT